MNKFTMLLISLMLAGVAHGQELSPISPEDYGGYCSAVRSVLRDSKPPGPIVSMICRPSFQPEYAISIYRSQEGFQITYRKAKEQIWHFKDIGNGSMALDLRTKTAVHNFNRAISTDLARGIILAWTRSVKRTRYQANEDGLDGVAYEFYASPDYWGETWTPSTGVAAKLVHLGDALREYASSHTPDEKLVQRSLTSLELQLNKPASGAAAN